MAGTALTYNSNSLQSAFVFTSDIKHESVGTKQAIPYILAHANGSVMPYTEYGSKIIQLQGTVTGVGVADLDNNLDIFRGYFAQDGQNLDIAYNGGTRRYVCTMTDLQIDRPGGLSWCNFTVLLTSLFGFGQDIATTSLVSATAATGATRADAVTFAGSAPYQLPVATMTYTALSGSGTQTVNFGNNANGQQITVSRTWTTGDVLVIDCQNRLVTVNGVPTDYAGGFPEFRPGTQTIAYADSFTTRTFNYSVTYYKRWL